MKAVVAALALLPMVSANGDQTLADLAVTLDVAFGNTGDILHASYTQRYVFACYTKSGVTTEDSGIGGDYVFQESFLDATLSVTAPSGGYVVGPSPPDFCGTYGDFTCGTCATGDPVYFVIDKRSTNCGGVSKVMIQMFSDLLRTDTQGPEPVADWSNIFYNLNIISGTRQYDISIDNSQSGGPTVSGPNWNFPSAYGDVARCDLRLSITNTSVVPQHCLDAANASQYQSLGCCNC